MTREEFLDILELGTNENTEGLCFKLLSENKEFLTFSFFKNFFGVKLDPNINISDGYIYFSFWCDKYGWYTFWVGNGKTSSKRIIKNNINTFRHLKSLHGN